MGIIANYQYLSNRNLKEMKLFYNEAVEDIEDVKDGNDDIEIQFGMDKMWDAMHFVLTGVGKDDAMENNPLSEAVFGVNSIKNSEEYIAYTQKSKVKDIVLALEDFDIEKALDNLNMSRFKKANIYPNTWDYEEDADKIREELMTYFQRLRDFYKKILEVNGNVVIIIC
ncbi:DUF1877 family protein [Lachnoanaerobaculum gingivalis]|jgi:hypothetical protein|uniref:DUF1877 family protein n=1 Tax=Lachnoanaerobaculum gingivalis TaxID=2490855 RepID=A0A3P3QZV3_9FIRM|nr:YfbM family protein [Lachnoanaerobaculum gingivalis]RRJ26757.1 DUF1877 family protein [Lachnoanaerobaculum gingivalis]WHE86428.1 YfbM family protein [Lachnoanaerobaculum gingivalis]